MKPNCKDEKVSSVSVHSWINYSLSLRTCSHAQVFKNTSVTHANLNFASQSHFLNAPLYLFLCEGSLWDLSFTRQWQCCVCVSVCLCVSLLLVSDLCVSSFSLPRSLHRGWSSVCQTGEHSFKPSPLSMSLFASSTEIFGRNNVFFFPLIFVWSTNGQYWA